MSVFHKLSQASLLITLAALMAVAGFTTEVTAFQEGSSQFSNRFREERIRRESALPASNTQPGQSAPQQDSLTPKYSRENENEIDVTACLTSPAADVEVPALTQGALSKIDVKEMQSVIAGQQLAQVDPALAEMQISSAKLQMEAAKARASDDVQIRYAQAAFNLAEKERQTNAELARKSAIPMQEYERSKLSAKQAKLQIEKSSHDFGVAQKEAAVEEYNVTVAQQRLQRHSIASPIDGNIVQIFKEPGEWTQEGESVMRVIQMSRMRVEGLLELAKYTPQDVSGKPVTVTMMNAGQAHTFEGRVVMIDLESNGGSRLTVRAEVENRQDRGRWLLPAGAEVEMKIHLQDPMASNGNFDSRR